VHDCDYHEEIKVAILNTTSTPFYFKEGDRIAQLVTFTVVKKPLYKECSKELFIPLVEQIRKEKGYNRKGGFGSTGVS
jgi:dUTPase